jgi:hypothetical protein
MCVLLNGSACQSKRELPDVSGIQVSVDILRFEKDLLHMDTSNPDLAIRELRQQYPDFLRCFSENMLVPRTPIDSTKRLQAALKRIIGYQGFLAAYDSTQSLYDDLSWLEDDLTQAFKYFKYYYPDSAVPQVVTFISEYQYGAVTCTDSTFGIGLDMFLGKDFSYYSTFEIGVPNYRLVKMEREYIVPVLLRAIAQNMYGAWAEQNTLIAQMIHNGKIAAFIDAMIPEEPDYLKIDYTPEQQQWCEDNEGEVWAHLKGEELLFKASKLEYMKYIADAPGTPGMPPEAPGNIGSWVGWQIVKAYMEQTGSTITEVMNEANYQKILDESRYKPRRTR